MTKIAVLSRFKETDESWQNELINNNYKVITYNKHSGQNLLPNVGRESHTYISYIINNYYNLPDEILFSQYDPTDHFLRANKEEFLHSYLYDFIGIRPGQFPYTSAKIRKVQWIETCKKIYRTFKQSDCSRLISTGSTLNGIFRVSQKAILSHSLDFYKRCIKLLDYSVHPIEGYFFERMWRFLFTDYGYIDEIKHSYLVNYPLLYKHNTHKSRVFNDTFGHIKLYSDGTIASNGICYHSHKNERFWQIKNNTILLFNYAGALTNRIYISSEFPFKLDTYDYNRCCLLSRTHWITNNGSVKDILMY